MKMRAFLVALLMALSMMVAMPTPIAACDANPGGDCYGWRNEIKLIMTCYTGNWHGCFW